MNLMKTLCSLVICFFVFQAKAQNTESGKLESTMKQDFKIKIDGEEYNYHIEVMEQREYDFEFKKEDAGKIDQDRISTPAKVTKLVRTFSDDEAMGDSYLLITYDRQVTDTFEVQPIDNGFKVIVDDKAIKYVFREGKYYVDTPDNDFFIVQEFSAD